ncbi:unnamed protein product [Allacma fusca]|uniref:Uncharacterized protein n=1 Tax=Allacma fusca TaxID=39272 RepID=A0A8J2PFP5_9HEXA|nr:unnamed protein product [Allacma fusca]
MIKNFHISFLGCLYYNSGKISSRIPEGIRSGLDDDEDLFTKFCAGHFELARYGGALTQWLAQHPMRVARTEDIPSIIRRPYEESANESTMINGFAKTGIFLSYLGAPNCHVFTDDGFTVESSGNVQTPEPSDNEDEDDNGGNDIPNPEEIVNAEDFIFSNDVYEDTPEDMRSNSNCSEPSIDVQFRDSPALKDNLRNNEETIDTFLIF